MEGSAGVERRVKMEDEEVSLEEVRVETGIAPGPTLESKELPGRRKRVLREKSKRMVAKEEELSDDEIPAAEDGSARKKRQRRSLQQTNRMEALVAWGMGFPPDHLTEEEIRAGVVGALGGIEQANYIESRNHILAKWRQNVDRWLPENLILENIRAEHKALVRTAYRFLSQAGYINFGVSPAIKERVRKGAPKATIIVIGAGLAGLAAARQLVAFGHKVVVLEGRGRPGGRVHTRLMDAGGHSASADLGGSVLTGTDGNPLGVLARQLKLPMHHIRSDPCPIYGLDGRRVDEDLDKQVEEEFNKLLDRADKTRKAIATVADSISLGSTLDTLRRSHRVAQAEDERQLLDWHMANLEYANAGLLHDLSLAYWDQDDPHEMAGDHCFLSGGNGRLVSALADGLPIFYGRNIQTVRYSDTGVRVHTSDGQVFEGDMALSTIPLGCLKRGDVTFDPPLPREKDAAIRRLGFGLLNKVALLFPHNFWGADLDTFGRVAPDAARRGEYFLFYSYAAVSGGSLLIALVAGEAAKRFEKKPSTDVIAEVMSILRSIYEPQGVEVPNPLSTLCTRWGSDPFAYGSYSHVAVGSSGDDYDVMAESCGNGRLFFAGEATTRWHPATMHGAFLTGLREAGWMDATAAARAAGQPLPVQIAPSSLSAQAVTLAEVFRNPDMEFGGFAVALDPRSSAASAPALLRLVLRSVNALTKPMKLPQDSSTEIIHTPTAPIHTPAASNGPSQAPIHTPAAPNGPSTAPIHTPVRPPTVPFHTGERPANGTPAAVDAPGAVTSAPNPLVQPRAFLSRSGTTANTFRPLVSNPALFGTTLGAPTDVSTARPADGKIVRDPKPQLPLLSNAADSQPSAKVAHAPNSQQPGSSQNPPGSVSERSFALLAASGGAAFSQKPVPPLETFGANQRVEPGENSSGELALGGAVGSSEPDVKRLQAEASQTREEASLSPAGLGSSFGSGSTGPALPIVRDGKKGVLLPPARVSQLLDTGAVLERPHSPGLVNTTAEAPVHTISVVPGETGGGVGGAGEQLGSRPEDPFSFPVVGKADSLRDELPAGTSKPTGTILFGQVIGNVAESNGKAGVPGDSQLSVDRGQSQTPGLIRREETAVVGSGGGVNGPPKQANDPGLPSGSVHPEPFHIDVSSGAAGAEPGNATGPMTNHPSFSDGAQRTDVRNDLLGAHPPGQDALRTPSLVADKVKFGLAQNPSVGLGSAQRLPVGKSNALPNERNQGPVADSPVDLASELPSEPGTVGAPQEAASALGTDPEKTNLNGQASKNADGIAPVLKGAPNGKTQLGAKKKAAAPIGKKRGRKRRRVGLAEVFTPQKELAVYTVITRGQAEELREVKGGDRARLQTLVETFGVKLVGRHGLGSAGASLLAALNGPHLVAGGLLPREEADAIKAAKPKKVPQENVVKPSLQLRPKRPKLQKGSVKLGSKGPHVEKMEILTETVSGTGKPELKDAVQA